MHVTWLRQQVQETSFEYRQHQLSMGVPRGQPTLLPAFTLPSGIGPLVAIHLQGLMTGSPELREQVQIVARSVDLLGRALHTYVVVMSFLLDHVPCSR